MTRDREAAIRRRTEEATPGPWKTGNWFGNRTLGSSVVFLSGNLPPVELDPHRNGRNDAAFIAHARNDIPALLAEIDRLRERLAAQIHETERAESEMSALVAAELAALPHEGSRKGE